MALDLSALTNPYGQELAGIERNRAMAAALMQSGQQQPQGQMISGRYVAPSFAQNLNPLLQTAVGLYSQNKTDEQATKLAELVRGNKIKAMQTYAELLQTDPEKAIPYALSQDYNPLVQDLARDRLKLEKYRKGEIGYREDFTGKQVIAGQGAPDLPAGYNAAIWEMNITPQQFNNLSADDKTKVGAKAAQINQSLHPKTVVNISDIMGKDIGQIKDLMEAGKSQVQAGELSMNAANKLDQAIKSGNLNVGPTATIGQTIGQIGDSLGLVNQKGQEKLVNTRSAIQGLAQMWMAGRQQGKGQGPITEGENALMGKISSGDLNNISIPELKYMVNQTKVQGNYFRQEYENKLNVLKQNPKFKEIVPFYEVGNMPNVQFNEAPIIPQSKTVNDALSIIRGNPTGASR